MEILFQLPIASQPDPVSAPLIERSAIREASCIRILLEQFVSYNSIEHVHFFFNVHFQQHLFSMELVLP